MKSDPTFLNAGSWHHGPNTLITWITFGEGRSLHQYMFEAPIDGDHTKVYLVNLRSFNLEPKHDDFIREANLRVTVEDIGVLEGLYPVRTPETRTKEILIPGDKAIVALPRLPRRLECQRLAFRYQSAAGESRRRGLCDSLSRAAQLRQLGARVGAADAGCPDQRHQRGECRLADRHPLHRD